MPALLERPAVFSPYGSETLVLPGDLPDRAGWISWSQGHDVRLWHHATDVDEPFSIFARQDEASIGFHFGTHAAACARHQIMFRMEDPALRQQQGFMIPTIVRYRKALRIPDKYCWDLDQVTMELVERDIVSLAEEEEILDACDPQAIFAALEVAGYDAILYPNETEGEEDGRQESLMVWRACQIRSVHAQSFIENDPRLCPSLNADPKEWHWWTENERGIDTWLQHIRTGREPCRPA